VSVISADRFRPDFRTALLITDYFRAGSIGILARKQGEIAEPMPEHESYPHDHESSDTVADEKRERHSGAGEAVTR